MPTDAERAQSEQNARDRLGNRIVFFSSIALSVVAVIVIGAGAFASYIAQNSEHALETSRLVFSSLLPLFGTWVGTVLAFYFSKENFKVASDATRDLINATTAKLSDKSVRDAMIPRAGIIAPVLVSSGNIDQLAFKDIETAFETEFASGRRITRMVVLDSNDVCLVIIHRSMWNEMHRVGAKTVPPVNFATGKLGDVLGLKTDANPKRTYGEFLSETVAYVAIAGTLADVKARMEAIEGCQDAVVTQTGGRTEPMRGWVTNVEIQKALQA